MDYQNSVKLNNTVADILESPLMLHIQLVIIGLWHS